MQETTRKFGFLQTSILDFEEVDDILPMHSHSSDANHISIVARGSFLLRGKGWSREVTVGDVIDFSDYQDHEFISKEKNSRLVNISKG